MTQRVKVDPSLHSRPERSVDPDQPNGDAAPPARIVRHWRLDALTLGGVMLGVVVMAALFAPWLAPFDPNLQYITQRLLPPSAHHWLGTAGFGRDLLSRVIRSEERRVGKECRSR